MSDTPISDSTPHNVAELGMLCRKFERELNEANERIKRLEEAGDFIVSTFGGTSASEVWNKAKEVNP